MGSEDWDAGKSSDSLEKELRTKTGPLTPNLAGRKHHPL